MENFFNILLFTHIPAGFLGLLFFWLPLIVKKGSEMHVKLGKIYVFLMWIVVVTAVLMCFINAFQKEYISASFLGFISILTLQPLWFGIAIMKYRKEVPLRILQLKRILSLTLFFSGLALLVWGIILKMQGQAVLLVIFGFIGLTAVSDAFKSSKRAINNTNWLKEHIGGMLGTGIAAHTAFFAFGGATFFQSIFSGPYMAIPWIMPSIVGTICIIRMNKKYGFA